MAIVIPLIDLTFGVLERAITKGLLLGDTAWLGVKGVEKGNDYLKEKERQKQIEQSKIAQEEKEGKQRDGSPGDHKRQNKQARGAIQDITRRIGRLKIICNYSSSLLEP